MNSDIRELVVDGDEIFDFVSYALSFKNAVDIEFRNCDFLSEDIVKLIEFKEYARIAFVRCNFENEDIIKNIKTKSISFTDSLLKNYDFVYNMNYLENLTIVNGEVDISKINNLENLQYLRLSCSLVLNIEMLNLKKLKYLFIDNTNIMDISFIEGIYSLDLLSISEEQELYNKEFIDKFFSSIKIIRNSIIESGVNSND